MVWLAWLSSPGWGRWQGQASRPRALADAHQWWRSKLVCPDPELVTGTGNDALQGMEGVGTQGHLINYNLLSVECSGEGHQQSGIRAS